MTDARIAELESRARHDRAALDALADDYARAQRRIAELEQDARRIADWRHLLHTASHALRSYEHGNGAPHLAATVADRIDAALTQEPRCGSGQDDEQRDVRS
jgi:hypothetical protein